MVYYDENISKPLSLTASLFLCVGLFFTSVNIFAANDLFKIDISPALIYESPDISSREVQSLYQAKDIKVLNIMNKWAQIEFSKEDQDVVGWIEKTYLKLQSSEVEESKPLTIMNIELDENVKDLFIVKSVADDLQCIADDNSDIISGCLVDIDLELESGSDTLFADILCKAEFEVISNISKKVLQEKRVRTPIKSGSGSVRLQIAIVPLFEKNIHSIKLLSHQCHIQKMIS